MLPEPTATSWRKPTKSENSERRPRKGRARRRSSGASTKTVATAAASLAAYPMTTMMVYCSATGDGTIMHHNAHHHRSIATTCPSNEYADLWNDDDMHHRFTSRRRRRRRGRRKDDTIMETADARCAHQHHNTNLPIDLADAIGNCRGGEVEMTSSASSSTHNGNAANSFYIIDDDFHQTRPSDSEDDHIAKSRYSSSNEIIANAYDNTKSSMDNSSSEVINAGIKIKRFKRRNQKAMRESSTPETTDDDETQHQLQNMIPHHQQHTSPFAPRPRLVIEFDTQAVGRGVEQGAGIRQRIRSRIRADENEWDQYRPSNRGPALSISLDAFSPSASSASAASQRHYSDDAIRNAASREYGTGNTNNNNNNNNEDQTTLLTNLLTPAQTTLLLLTQTVTLLPPLILSRRALNSAWIAVVDYFRGRIFRTAFTKLERAYLRYYEFPAVTRAMARLVSQLGILLGLSWAVRWWMVLVLMGNDTTNLGPMVMGVTGIDVGMVGTSGGGGQDWDWKTAVVGLPCHGRGKGMAWLCGFFWVGSVVSIGHACAMALSVWGGPLRLQAVAQQTENPKHVLRRIIHHPIIWIRELEEWKHLSSLNISLAQRKQTNKKSGKDRNRNNRGTLFNPDPILFPSTWLFLRWLQIFAVAKAFSTNPLKYRWCSPEDDKIVIPRLMKQYLVQLALGDEWHRVFLGEKRVGLGIAVVFSYFIALLFMVFTAFTLDGGAAAMLIPSVLAAMISGLMNIMIFWNRLGTKEQRKALNAMGFA